MFCLSGQTPQIILMRIRLPCPRPQISIKTCYAKCTKPIKRFCFERLSLGSHTIENSFTLPTARTVTQTDQGKPTRPGQLFYFVRPSPRNHVHESYLEPSQIRNYTETDYAGCTKRKRLFCLGRPRTWSHTGEKSLTRLRPEMLLKVTMVNYKTKTAVLFWVPKPSELY